MAPEIPIDINYNKDIIIIKALKKRSTGVNLLERKAIC